MNKTIKIGFLFPFSNIAPNMSQDIIDGFFSAIPEQYRTCFHFFPEYIDKGNNELVKTAVNKLCVFHNVDIVSGIISYKLIAEISNIIEQSRKLAFFFDLGEYLPPVSKISGSVFFNSLQMWQMEFALGRWATSKFNGKGAILMSIYEAGYHMHSSFCQGAFSQGIDEIDMHILPYDPNVRDIEEQLEVCFGKIAEAGVEYMHALFCGSEAKDFYKAFLKSGLVNRMPLIVTSHMASEELISGLDCSGLNLYTASGWNYDSLEEKNVAFKKIYGFLTGKRATEFAAMGFEMGELFNRLMTELLQGEKTTIINAINSITINGPRGTRNFHHDLSLAAPTIDIEKIVFKNNKATKIIVDQGKALRYNNEAFSNIHVQSVSGWKNPYLCI